MERGGAEHHRDTALANSKISPYSISAAAMRLVCSVVRLHRVAGVRCGRGSPVTARTVPTLLFVFVPPTSSWSTLPSGLTPRMVLHAPTLPPRSGDSFRPQVWCSSGVLRSLLTHQGVYPCMCLGVRPHMILGCSCSVPSVRLSTNFSTLTFRALGRNHIASTSFQTIAMLCFN